MTEPMGDANDILFGGGVPAAAFTSPGDTFAGKIVRLEAMQQRKFDKGKPSNELDYWPDGSKKMMAVITLATDHRDPADPSDDGHRKVYAASRDMTKKIREAVKQAGRKQLDVGAYMRVTMTAEERVEGTSLMAKIYEVEYQPVSGVQAQQALGLDQPAAPTTIVNNGVDLSALPADVAAKVQAMYAAQQG